MSSIEAAVNNLAFDRAFLQKVKAVETANQKTLHTNGVPLHYVLVFKVIISMKDEDLSMENISVKYRDIFGRSINASSLSRTLLYLSDKADGGTLGLISYVDNPFSSKSKNVRLTKSGKLLQKVFLGTTSSKNSSLDSLVIPSLKHNMRSA